jgi:hypothetical protein
MPRVSAKAHGKPGDTIHRLQMMEIEISINH